MRKITREHIQHHKEDIIDLIQHLADVLRYSERKPDAPNANFFEDYLKFARSSWSRIFM